MKLYRLPSGITSPDRFDLWKYSAFQDSLKTAFDEVENGFSDSPGDFEAS